MKAAVLTLKELTQSTMIGKKEITKQQYHVAKVLSEIVIYF